MPLAGLDLVIAIIILVSALIGLMRGFIKEVISLLSWVAALVLAIYLAPAVADILPANWAALQLRMGMAFVLVFVLTLVAASLLRWVLTQLVESTGLSGTDRVIGLPIP